MSPQKFRILHLSDLHFGRIDSGALRDLQRFIDEQGSSLDLIVLTGDLTQRARKSEFIEARSFIENLRIPVFIIPGNHDVPLYNIFLRLLSPYKKFCRYLGPFASNFFQKDNVSIVGLWSTNRFTISDGKITRRDIQEIEDKFKSAQENSWRIIASHHPISPEKILKLKPHLFLSGHDHQSKVEQSMGGPVFISCGTTVSSRTRAEVNSFNIINLEGQSVSVDVFYKEQDGFSFNRTFQGVFQDPQL